MSITEDRRGGEPAVDDHPYVVLRVAVGRVQRLSSNFVRVTLVGDRLADFGNPGATFDQRVKLIFPPASGVLPEVGGGADWYREWLAIGETERGSMRTYSVRDIRLDADGRTAVDVDFVLHLVPGKTGPASSWAAAAAVGDELIVVGPRRGRHDGGGVEYLPGSARQVLLAGDETAAPAIARILADAPPELCGVAYIEIPQADDAQRIDGPEGVAVHWLPRDGAAHGERLHPAVLGHLGEAGASIGDDLDGMIDAAGDELVWETPTFSRLGEDLDGAVSAAAYYFWIAGESRMLTT